MSEREEDGGSKWKDCVHGWKSSCWSLVTVVAHLHLASSSILSLTDAFLFKINNQIVKTCIIYYMCIYVTRSCNGTLSQKTYNVTIVYFSQLPFYFFFDAETFFPCFSFSCHIHFFKMFCWLENWTLGYLFKLWSIFYHNCS